METIVTIIPKSKRAKARLPKVAHGRIVKTLSMPLEINGRVFDQPVLIECGSSRWWMCGSVDIEVISPV